MNIKDLIILILAMLLIILIYGIYIVVTEYNSIDNDYKLLKYDYYNLELKSYLEFNKHYLNLTEPEFYIFIAKYYQYEKVNKDCKYWTYFYKQIFQKLGYNTKYILLEDSHIFLIAYNENKYITLDGLDIRTIELN